VDKRNRSAATHEKIYSFSNDKLWTSETEVQQRTKKSSHYQITNCGQANPKCSNAPKYPVIFKLQTVEKQKTKCSNAPKNLVIFK